MCVLVSVVFQLLALPSLPLSSLPRFLSSILLPLFPSPLFSLLLPTPPLFHPPPPHPVAEASPSAASKRGVGRSAKVTTSESFEWQASPTSSEGKHMPRPPSSAPIYESIPEQLTLQASGGEKGKQDKRNRASLVYDKLDQPSKPLSRLSQPQLPPPVLPVQKRGGVSRKSVSPEKTGRLAPIGGVTKLNPLLDEQNQLSVSAVEQGGTEDLGAELPTQAVSGWSVEEGM